MSYKPHLPELVSDLKSNPSLIHDAEFLDLKHVLETAFASTFPPKSNTTANNEEDVEDNVDIKIEDRDIVGPEVEPVDPPLLSVKEGEELSETDMNSMMEAKSNASQAFSNGDFASALEEYTKALRLQPTSALTFSKRAECFVKLKRNKAAKQDCEQALKINPDSAKAMKVLGTAQRYLGEYEEACKNLGQGLAIDFDEESAKVEKEAVKILVVLLVGFVALVLLDSSSSLSSNERISNSNYLAQLKRPRRANVPGNLFVDESCIDCDTCRWMCPQVYGRSGIKSAVTKQPEGEDEKIAAYMAMIACPTGSIRLSTPDGLVKDALAAFPVEIDSKNIPGIMHMGFHSASSYGATPYMILREDGKNIVIDSARYNAKLADTIEEECGGIDYMVLTHRDDVQDHDKWKLRFPNLQRIIHRLDVQKTSKTDSCEVQLEGLGEWEPAPGFKIVHTPGHTPGSLCILIQTTQDTVLFTGDSLAYSKGKQRLEGFKRYNKGSFEAQQMSLMELAQDKYNFTWILPGHGRMANFASLEEKRAMVMKAAEEFAIEDEDDKVLGIGYQ